MQCISAVALAYHCLRAPTEPVARPSKLNCRSSICARMRPADFVLRLVERRVSEDILWYSIGSNCDDCELVGASNPNTSSLSRGSDCDSSELSELMLFSRRTRRLAAPAVL
jgi:hypothetical protein